MHIPGKRLARAGAAAMLLGGMILGGSGVVAQEGTPGAGTGEADQGVFTLLPVTINPGLCAEAIVPEAAYDLGQLGPIAGEGGVLPMPEDIEGYQTSPPVLNVAEEVDAELDELLDQPHSVIVHAGETGGMESYLACGELGGPVEDDELVIGLRPLNDSGYYGIAIFAVDEGTPIIGEEQLEATVYLFQDIGPEGPVGVGVPPEGTPVATPEIDIPEGATPVTDATLVPPAEVSPAGPSPAAEGAVEELTVASYDIYFEPADVTIASNTDVVVTLPNYGAAPHNFAIDELGISVDIAPGATETVVINAPPGEYTYYCNVPGHREAGMIGTLIVQ